MAKTKHQNGKTRKQPHVKKQGKVTDTVQFRAQLDALGLKIIQVTADGNCFFRAIADQLEGNEEEHQKFRHMVVEYIQKNRETFEPFIEDDIPFDEYCQSMGEEGTWAGNMELQAGSLVTHSNICIHRSMSPRWYIRNFDEHGACMVHLSYHDEEHYNSVRIKEDPCNGPAKPIIIKADADISAIAHQPKAASTRSKGGTGEDIIHDGSIKMVMAGTGCQNAEKVKQVLEQVHGDVDLAIEFLIAELGTEEYLEETNSLHGQSDASMVMTDGNSDERDKEPVEQTCLKDASSNGVKKSFHDDCPQPDDKKISRNKACPCGSKKKYKVCCGAVSGRSSTKFVINQPVDSRKKKERKQGKKGGPAKTVSTCGSDGGPPDLDISARSKRELRHHSDSKCGHGSPFEHLPDVAGLEKHSQVPLEFDNYLAGKLACQYNDLLLTLNARLQGCIVYPSMRVGLQNSCLLLKQDYGITENSIKHLLFILFFWEICLSLPNLLS